MSEEKSDVPEGMECYTMLGQDIIAPAGLPQEFVAAIFESMVAAGVMVFDPETNTIKKNPDDQAEEGVLQGLSIDMGDDLSIKGARKLTDEEIAKDISNDPTIPDRLNELMRKMKGD